MPAFLKSWIEHVFGVVERCVTALLYPACILKNRLGLGDRIPILMYHQVGRAPKGAAFCDDCVSPRRFAIQMEALVTSGYRVVSLGRLLRDMDGAPRGAFRRHAVLTFDDGLRDQFVHACPILARLGLPATFFLVAGSIGTRRPLPHLDLEGACVRGEEPAAGWRPLTWKEVREMVASGMEIGSHSLTHRSLGRLGAGETAHEIRASREILERHLGLEVDLFAYPFGSQAYGDFNPGVQEALREAGFRAACTTVVGRNDRGTDRLALRRLPIEERDGPFRIRCKLAGAYDWVGGVKTLWQRLAPRSDRVGAPSFAPAAEQGRQGA